MSKPKETIICFGAGPAYKGGMSNYNTSLAKAFSKEENTDVHIVSWSQQYPSIVPREFKDKVSELQFLENSKISCKYITNYNNPFSWGATVNYITSLKPTKVIIQWSIAIQGLPISKIVKKLKQDSDCEVILDLHFVIQKEESKIDKYFTKIGISKADSFIVHALKTFEELQSFFPKRKFDLVYPGDEPKEKKGEGTKVLKLFHPIYDLYQPDPEFDITKFKTDNNLKENVFLYFGFIRKYKGLHNAIKAFNIVAKQREDVSFMICGELFWNTLDSENFVTKLKKGLFSVAKKLFMNSTEDEKNYNPLTLVDSLNLQDRTMVVSTFIPNEDVNKYFQAANAGILFYERATPSGIESLSYNFNLPILTSKVGHFPETIRNGENGYIVEENTVEKMAKLMLKYLDNPIPSSNIEKFKDNLSWETYVKTILKN